MAVVVSALETARLDVEVFAAAIAFHTKARAFHRAATVIAIKKAVARDDESIDISPL
jgi:hypothetical protein